MLHRIEHCKGIKLIGVSGRMSIQDNHTPRLWRELITSVKKQDHELPVEKYSVEVYDDLSYFVSFDPENEFTKWAAVKEKDLSKLESLFKELYIPEGKYIVYSYRGSVKETYKAYQYIFTVSIPELGFKLDDRPHFSLMTDTYLGDDENSEEEIWIPIC